MPDQDPAAAAGTAYSQLIADQLAEERNRKVSLESRGVAVITTSGTLATLLFALTASLTAVPKFRLPGDARLPLLLALLAFVTAALFGLVTNVPLRYREPTPQGLAKLVDTVYWRGPKQTGELRVAGAQVAVIAAARSANNLKVNLLLTAISAELLSVIFLSWAVAVIIYRT
jgi:hypothetical protein